MNRSKDLTSPDSEYAAMPPAFTSFVLQKLLSTLF